MGKEQNIRVAYVKPEIKTVHILMGSMILEVSFPGDHNPGVHKTGPTEESSEEAKSSCSFYDQDRALGRNWED